MGGRLVVGDLECDEPAPVAGLSPGDDRIADPEVLVETDEPGRRPRIESTKLRTLPGVMLRHANHRIGVEKLSKGPCIGALIRLATVTGGS